MPSRRTGGGGTTRRKHSLGNLRRAHPASGATWNVQVVRGKMSSKCLWHACRALILGLTLMLLGAGMATLGYYADHLSMGSEIRGNVTVRVKNDLKGFHLNNFSYVGPIVMGFGGFIVVASCVMTFEARDSAAKVVPARLRAGGSSKTTLRSNQSSSASQRRAMGLQMQSARWDQQFGVFRSSPADPPSTQTVPFDRDALTAELIQFSKSLSASARFSPKLRRLPHTGSVPNLSTHVSHTLAQSTNISHLLSPNHKNLLLLEQSKRHHRHHHHRHHHQRQHYAHAINNNITTANNNNSNTSSARHAKQARGTRISNSLIQRNTRENIPCALLQPPPSGKVYWHASSFDESSRVDSHVSRHTERAKRSDTAKRHVLARQRPVEHDEDRASPMANRRNSTLSDSSYSGRWTVRCASIASRTSSIDSRRVPVDIHSPEVMPKSILRSPKRYCSGPSATPSVEKEFRSQLSVCSEPPPPLRQLSGQSSLEPCFPEESIDIIEDKNQVTNSTTDVTQLPDALFITTQTTNASTNISNNRLSNMISYEQRQKEILYKPKSPSKKSRPDSLPINAKTSISEASNLESNKSLQRSHSSRTFDRRKPQVSKDIDDSIFYIRSLECAKVNEKNNEAYDSLQVINERRSTLLRTESETALPSVQRIQRTFSFMQNIPEKTDEYSQSTSIDIDDNDTTTSNTTVQKEQSEQHYE